ncbi:MAG: SIR2 family protein [Saprospiraceae bacterium]|nr:SIR2 family protein [Saprospiraceae bacterium]
MTFQLQREDILILLGAGASQEAGIPITIEMIEKIESKLEYDWKKFKGLYNFIKAQVFKVSSESLNVEDLVNILDELLLLLNKQHPLSPFQLSWIEFIENVGYTVYAITEFRDLIIDSLRGWIALDNQVQAKYYQEIALFQKELNNPLRIFTLNYDLCIESVCDRFKHDGKEVMCEIERGFGNEREVDEAWHWSKFKIGDEEADPDIYLYKIHGSIDWERDHLDKIFRKSPVKIKRHEIIFGTRQKIRAYDPFLFFIYEFREYCIKAKVIIVSGYGFWDDHINKILKQALNEDSNRILLVNAYKGTPDDHAIDLANRLSLANTNQIRVIIGNASTFFKESINLKFINSIFPDEDLPF